MANAASAVEPVDVGMVVGEMLAVVAGDTAVEVEVRGESLVEGFVVELLPHPMAISPTMTTLAKAANRAAVTALPSFRPIG